MPASSTVSAWYSARRSASLRRRWALAVFVAWILAPALLQAEDLDPIRVKEAIDKAVNYLKLEQLKDGTWPAWGTHDITALCALALLNAGVEPDSETIQRS